MHVLVPGRERLVQRQQFPGRLGARRVVRDDPAGLRERKVLSYRVDVHTRLRDIRATVMGAISARPDEGDHASPLRFQAPIISGHSIGRSANRAASRLERGQCRRGGILSGDAPSQGDRQQTAQNALQHEVPGTERFDAAGDIGAVGSSDAGLREQRREPGTGLHVGPGRAERADDDAAHLVDAGQLREHAHGTEVIVLHDEVTARRDRVPQASQHGHPLRQVEQQQARVNQVERRAGDRTSAVRS